MTWWQILLIVVGGVVVLYYVLAFVVYMFIAYRVSQQVKRVEARAVNLLAGEHMPFAEFQALNREWVSRNRRMHRQGPWTP